MAKKTKGKGTKAAKGRAAKTKGGKGPVKKRSSCRK